MTNKELDALALGPMPEIEIPLLEDFDLDAALGPCVDLTPEQWEDLKTARPNLPWDRLLAPPINYARIIEALKGKNK